LENFQPLLSRYLPRRKKRMPFKCEYGQSVLENFRPFLIKPTIMVIAANMKSMKNRIFAIANKVLLSMD
jgi:hypothetical protein